MVRITSLSQSIKMVLKGRYKFGFLTEEIPHPPPGDSQDVFGKGKILSFKPY